MKITIDLNDEQLTELLVNMPATCGWTLTTFDAADVLLAANRLAITYINPDNYKKVLDEIEHELQANPGGRYATVFIE
jgi:hypothetical protein